MTDSTETNAAIVARLFQGEDARMGTKWLESVSTGWTETSLHCLVETTGTLSAAKTKEIYGHFRTKTQMKSQEGPYWKPNPTADVQSEAKRLNVQKADAVLRLQQLRTDAIGGFLLLTCVVDKSGEQTSFLTVIAAPSVATFNTKTGDPGVTLEDLWDDTVLAEFLPGLETSEVHCPLMGGQEGFSRAKTLKPSVIGLLQDSQPLFSLLEN